MSLCPCLSEELPLLWDITVPHPLLFRWPLAAEKESDINYPHYIARSLKSTSSGFISIKDGWSGVTVVRNWASACWGDHRVSRESHHCFYQPPTYHRLKDAPKCTNPLALLSVHLQCPVCSPSQSITSGREQQVFTVNSPQHAAVTVCIIWVQMVSATQSLIHLLFLNEVLHWHFVNTRLLQ